MRAMTGEAGVRPTAAALAALAESWRPWRAYAAMHLWIAEGERLAAAADAKRAKGSKTRKTAVREASHADRSAA
jgi:AraC family transcriptional regulator of adaptative response / DNA-3-methyladenine glycosylase II